MKAGIGFSTESSSDQISANSSGVPTMSSLPKLKASVHLPPSLFSSILSNITDVGIIITVYKTVSLFPVMDSMGGVSVSPLIIGITVTTGQQIRNLTNPVVFNFSIPNAVSSNGTFSNVLNYTCASWDFKASGNIRQI